MIQGISNMKYEFYQMSKKEIEKMPSALALPRINNNNKPSNDELYHSNAYNQYEGMRQTPKNEWQRFIEQIEEKDEAYGSAMQSGYTLENKELAYLNQLDYRAAKKETNEKQISASSSQKIERIKEGHDSMYYYGVQHQGTITINDLYKWSFGGDAKGPKHQYSKEQLGSLLGMNGLDQTPKNLKAVDKLLGLGLDVSKETVTKIQNMETAVEGLDQHEESQKILEETIPLMEDEKILYTEKDIQDIVEELGKVKEDTIGEVLGKGEEVTISNLREVLHKNTEKALGRENKEVNEQVGDQVGEPPAEKIEDLKAKVNDIRAKLSVEAAQKISEKMPLESTELSKLAKELSHIQEEKVVDALKSVALEPNVENKEILTQTVDAVMMMGRQKALAIELQVEDESVTLEQIHHIAKAYEEQALEPEKRFGETLKKVEGQIEEFLKSQNIEVTAEVIEGAKALVANGIPLTVEALENVVPLVTQMNVFLEEMTPHRAATLIKEGINPYKASVGNLTEWIAAERLPELKDSLGEAILALEEKGKITDAQKQSLLGLYRILDGVEAHKFEVAGYLYKNGLPMTVEKLQEAISYSQKSEHIQAKIDDQFGELEKISYTKKTSRMMLQEAKTEQDKMIEYIKILEHMEMPFEGEEGIKDYSKVSQKIYPFVKEYLKQNLDQFEGIDTLPDSFKEKMQVIKNLEPEVIKAMEKYEIPLTLSHMYWMQKLVKEPNLYQKLIQREALGEKEFPKTFEEIEKFIKEKLEHVEEAKGQAMSNGDFLGYRNYKQLEEVLGLQKQLMDKEGLYHIPFMIEGEQKIVQLYIKENQHKKSQDKDSTKIAITYDTKRLGKVNAYVEITDKQIRYEIFGESHEATTKLRTQDNALKKMLENIGYALLEGQYIHDSKESTVVEPMPKRSESQFEASV